MTFRQFNRKLFDPTNSDEQFPCFCNRISIGCDQPITPVTEQHRAYNPHDIRYGRIDTIFLDTNMQYIVHVLRQINEHDKVRKIAHRLIKDISMESYVVYVFDFDLQ